MSTSIGSQRSEEGVLRLYRGLPGFEAALEPWRSLERRMDSKRFYHRPEWYRAYLEVLDPDPDSAVIVVVERGGEPVGLLPLRRRRGFMGVPGVRVLELPWHPHKPVSDAVALPGIESALVPALVAAHRSGALRWDVLHARHIPVESRLTMAVLEGGERSGLRTVVSSGGRSAYIRLREHESYIASLSRNARANLRRANRLLEKRGTPGYRTADSPAELDRAFEIFLRLESSGWKGADGTGSAVALSPQLVQFYRQVLREFGQRGRGHMKILEDGTRPIAALLCLEAGGVLAALKIGMDPAYGRCSPGMLLLERVLAESAGEPRLHAVDLISDLPWLAPWRPSHRELAHVHLCNRTPRGASMSEILRARTALARVYHARIRRDRGARARFCERGASSAPAPPPRLLRRERVTR